ncbi:hypothetical protein ACETK8_19950 (plasmid) [Brevundimonas staleyi]|uniref:Uncharacterized protein n=1 Tax=Brevundimonas staleyi TaxID=74326 RepID=A0ABW0FNK2_9CAUL
MPHKMPDLFPFEVSGGPVRDALARLAAEGFIRYDRDGGKGHSTKEWTVKEQHDLHCLAFIFLTANMRCMVDRPTALFQEFAALDPDVPNAKDAPERVAGYFERLLMGLAYAGRNETLIEMNQTVVDRTHLVRLLDYSAPQVARSAAVALRTFSQAMLDEDLDTAQAAGQSQLDGRVARLPQLVEQANARARQARIP